MRGVHVRVARVERLQCIGSGLHPGSGCAYRYRQRFEERREPLHYGLESRSHAFNGTRVDWWSLFRRE